MRCRNWLAWTLVALAAGCGNFTLSLESTPLQAQEYAGLKDVQTFRQYDVDQDGFLDADEFIRLRIGNIPGILPSARLQLAVTQEFRQLDTNGDKRLDLDEFRASQKATPPLPNTPPNRFSNVRVSSIKRLQELCPCFELKADANGQAVSVRFSEEGVNSISIDSVNINGEGASAQTVKELGEALANSAYRQNESHYRLLLRIAEVMKQTKGYPGF